MMYYIRNLYTCLFPLVHLPRYLAHHMLFIHPVLNVTLTPEWFLNPILTCLVLCGDERTVDYSTQIYGERMEGSMLDVCRSSSMNWISWHKAP